MCRRVLFSKIMFTFITGAIFGAAIYWFTARAKMQKAEHVEKAYVQLFNTVDTVRRESAEGVYSGAGEGEAVAAKLNFVLREAESYSELLNINVRRKD